MPVSQAQKEAKKRYERAKVKRVAVAFYPGDEELYNHMKNQESMAGYVKNLIRRDLEA